MAVSETSICNMALGRIGAERIVDFSDATETSVSAVQCRLHYAQTRDALLQSHAWAFALARVALSEDTTAPAFEWDNQFILPNDCLRTIGLYDTDYSYAIEGDRLLTNDSTASLTYIRKVTDPAEFSPLFVEVLVLELAIKLIMPLAQDKTLRRELQDELRLVMSDAHLVNLDETNTVGRADRALWVDARLTGAPLLSDDPSHLG